MRNFLLITSLLLLATPAISSDMTLEEGEWEMTTQMKMEGMPEGMWMGEDANRLPPFLKWAEEKRWLVSSHSHILSAQYNRFVLPFLGSSTIFFLQQSKE